MSEPAGAEGSAHTARSRALAVLRIRSTALAIALLPAAAAVVLLAATATGRISDSPGWDTVRWTVAGTAAVALLLAGAVTTVVARARPAVTPTVPIAEHTAPDLYRLVRDLADRLDVPAPSALALTPDCDSWLEDRTHPAHAPPGTAAGRRVLAPPVLVIGSPFLWWVRVAELRALLAPVVAGTGPSAHPDIAAARRFVRGLDAAVAVSARRPALAFVGWVARILLRGCRDHAAEMERGVAAAASARAQSVDYGLRIVAQEQVGLAYAGWDRLLTRVALPAWRMGRWPTRLDAGVVSALTELSRRDRLADGFASRLGERPACDLLDEPGAVDEAASLLAARLFHGGPAEPGPDWSPVAWSEYPEEVVDRKWRSEAARLHTVLDEMDEMDTSAHRSGCSGPSGAADASGASGFSGPSAAVGSSGPPSARPARRPDHGSAAPAGSTGDLGRSAEALAVPQSLRAVPAASPDTHEPGGSGPPAYVTGPTLARVIKRLTAEGGRGGDELAARIGARLAREEAADGSRPARPHGGQEPATMPGGAEIPAVSTVPWADGFVPLFPLQAPRTDRELLADHVTAMVCCAAVDTAGAMPGLDWLDGPVLLLAGRRGADLGPPVLRLVEEGDAEALRGWLSAAGVRPEKPVRLV